MKRLSLAFKFFAAAMFTLALCSVAQAIPQTFVASFGIDGVPCTRVSPCRTFNHAITKTDPGGTVTAIDSAEYGGAIIITNRSITIDGGEGLVSIITAANVYGVFVDVGATDTVIIRNVTINGHDVGSTGIHYGGGGGQLFLQNVIIERVAGNGLFVEGASAANLVRAEINDSRFMGNLVGIQMEDNSQVALRESVITGTLHKGPPNSFGINMQPSSGTIASIKLERNEISYCQSGLRAVGSDVGGGNPTWWGRDNHFYGNTIGVNMTTNVTYHSAGGNLLSENPFPFFGGVNAGVPSL